MFSLKCHSYLKKKCWQTNFNNRKNRLPNHKDFLITSHSLIYEFFYNNKEDLVLRYFLKFLITLVSIPPEYGIYIIIIIILFLNYSIQLLSLKKEKKNDAQL